MNKNNIIHLPGLNGLRAIAAMAVVISHITLSLGDFGLVSTIFGSDQDGNPKGLLLASYGVSIFFALSGFLITFLLLKEKERTLTINIKYFYMRRLLRIWPLYYLVLTITIFVYYIFEITYNQNMVPFYIFLAANIPIIINSTLPFLGHFWSIGVEEQFYLFWPWLAKIKNKIFIKVLFILLIFLIGLKILFWLINYKYNYSLPLVAISVSRFDTMIIGGIGAFYYYHNSKYNKYFTNRITQIISWSILFLVAINFFHISSLIDNEIIALITVFIIFAQITRTNYMIDLDNKVLDFIGRISFGIYVIHPLIIFLCSKSMSKFNDSSISNYLIVYSVIIVLTVVISYLSYSFYEKQFIKLKSKFTKVKSGA